jgi:hypothetical protein
MSRKTMLALLAQADTTIEDNTTQAITAADVRNMIKDVVDSFCPGYGIASSATVTLTALGLTPVVIVYDTQLSATADYTIALAAGTITRLAHGLPSTVNRISFYADVSAPAGDEVVFSLHRDALDIPGGVTVSGQGGGNIAQAALSIATSAEDALDHAYDIRATKTTGGADNVVLTNVRFIVEIIPTIGI